MRRAGSAAVTLLAILSGYICTVTIEQIVVWHRIERFATYLSVLAAVALAVLAAVAWDWVRPTRRSFDLAIVGGLILLLWSLLPLLS